MRYYTFKLKAGVRAIGLLAFIKGTDNGSGRVTNRSVSFLENTGCESLVFACVAPQNCVVGISMWAFDDTVNFTAVHPNFRNRGIGTRLLRAKVRSNPNISCMVAEDNEFSKRMCERAGLAVSGSHFAVRRKGELYVVQRFRRM